MARVPDNIFLYVEISGSVSKEPFVNAISFFTELPSANSACLSAFATVLARRGCRPTSFDHCRIDFGGQHTYQATVNGAIYSAAVKAIELTCRSSLPTLYIVIESSHTDFERQRHPKLDIRYWYHTIDDANRAAQVARSYADCEEDEYGKVDIRFEDDVCLETWSTNTATLDTRYPFMWWKVLSVKKVKLSLHGTFKPSIHFRNPLFAARDLALAHLLPIVTSTVSVDSAQG